MTSLAELGEKGAIRLVLDIIRSNWPCKSLEPGDDAYCVPGREEIVFNIDGYSLEKSLLPWMSLKDLGWKAAVASMSDLVAKAARPLALAVSVGLRGTRSVGDLVEIVSGVFEAARAHGAFLLGGDTNGAGATEWIDVVSIGVVERGPLGFKPQIGNLVYTTVGRYGLTGIAFSLLLKRVEPPREAVEATRRPRLPLGFIFLAERVGPDCISSGRDVSDGLAYTLYEAALKANATLVLENLPITPHVAELAKQYGVDAFDAVLYGGEEYEIVFTVKPSCRSLVEEVAEELKLPVMRIGRLLEGAPSVVYRGRRIVIKYWDQYGGFMAVAIGGGSSPPRLRG